MEAEMKLPTERGKSSNKGHKDYNKITSQNIYKVSFRNLQVRNDHSKT